MREKDNLYEPERIVDKKKEGKFYLYLIKWKGYKASESTWEKYENIAQCTFLFKEWEEKQFNEAIKQLKYMDQIIDKKYDFQNRVYYLVRFTNGTEDKWFKRKYIKKANSQKMSEYEQCDGLTLKRKYKERVYSEKQDRYLSSSESDEESGDEESKEDRKQGDKNTSQRRKKSYSSKQIDKESQNTKKNDSRGGRKQNTDENSRDDCGTSSDEDSQNNDSSRRMVQAKRNGGGKKKIEYDKLPNYGICGIDTPLMIRQMVIDMEIGKEQDGYFACEIAWKVRPNKKQPIDSIVSRTEIKQYYPLTLIEYYEQNMEYDDTSINDGYSNNNSKAKVNSKTKVNSYYNNIPLGYAQTVDQKKFVKFDEAFKYKNQMEEMP